MMLNVFLNVEYISNNLNLYSLWRQSLFSSSKRLNCSSFRQILALSNKWRNLRPVSFYTWVWWYNLYLLSCLTELIYKNEIKYSEIFSFEFNAIQY